MRDSEIPERHNYLVCICTRNREESLTRLLESLDKTSYRELRVLIVDSTNPEARYLAFDPTSHFRDATRLERIKISKGLPSARNLGIDQIKSEDVVVFLDDDVTVPQDFFNKLNAYFALNYDVHALGVRIAGQYIARKTFASPFSLSGNKQNFGKVTRSAENIWVPDETFGEMYVEWLPGCCMIFKTEVFRNLRFNENLEDGPTGGYALGEDLDFTYACSRDYVMSATDSITVTHHFESSSRDNERAMSIANGMFKAYLKNKFPQNFSDFRIIARQGMKFAWIYREQSLVKVLLLTILFTKSYLIERLKKNLQDNSTKERKS